MGLPIELSRRINLRDRRIRSLIISLASRGLLFLGSIVFSYYFLRYAMTFLDPTHEEKRRRKQHAELLAQQINLSRTIIKDLNEYELCILSDLINPTDIPISWTDIGGLEETIDHLRETIIYPLQHPNLFQQSKLLTTSKGVLLYGPPGCGKTMLAKAIAKEAGANFINLQVTSLLDKWYGESQKRTAAVFSLAKKLQPAIIFIDEIDSFMRTRHDDDHESTRMVKTQFMTLWDGLETNSDDQRILVIGATNRVQDLDAAILRRMPTRYHIPLPNEIQRVKIFELILQNEQLHTDVDLKRLAKDSLDCTGSDIHEICRQAAMQRVVELCHQQRQENSDRRTNIPSSELRSITQADFLQALKKVRANQQRYRFSEELTLD